MWSFNYFWQWRRETWRAFWRQPGITGAIGLNIIILAANWWLALYNWPSRDNFSVIRYSAALGPNWVGDNLSLILLPLTATGFALINVALAYSVGRRTLILKQVWLWLSCLISLGFLGQTVLLFWLNS